MLAYTDDIIYVCVHVCGYVCVFCWMCLCTCWYVCIKKYACGVSRSERMGVLERGVPGTLEAGDGTGELV